jgi:branched-chain amino acid transport system ATP-binding protein
LIIEHDMDLVFALAERITVLHYGTVIADGTPQEVKNNPQVMDAYLGT